MGKFFLCALCCLLFATFFNSLVYSNGWNLGQQLVCLSRGDSVGGTIGLTCSIPFTAHDLLVLLGCVGMVWLFYKKS
jgi:hypothetical protein